MQGGSPRSVCSAEGRFFNRYRTMSRWLLSFSVLALVAGAGVTTVGRFDSRLAQLEERRTLPDRISSLTRELAVLRTRLEESQEALGCLDEERARRTALEARILELEGELEVTNALFEVQQLELGEVEARQDELVREALGTELATLNEDLEARWERVSQTLEATSRIAESNRDQYSGLLEDLRGLRELQSQRLTTPRSEPVFAPRLRNPEVLWDSLMGPTVQIADESTVGSGVLLQSEEIGPDRYRTYLLTAWHVVRDVLDNPTQLEELVPVYVYQPSGERHLEWARVVVRDAALDSALLVMDTVGAFPHGATLPTREGLAAQSVFDEIYAVGCPLGNDPIPTAGELADLHHEVGGQELWMISAPTYIGNSGGGVFDAETRELVGIFTKIYTHGSLRPTVVPHMGLVTPLAEIYDWLESVGQGHVVPR